MSMPKAPQKSVFSTLLKNNCDGGGDARGRRYQIEYGHRYRYRYRYSVLNKTVVVMMMQEEEDSKLNRDQIKRTIPLDMQNKTREHLKGKVYNLP